MVLNNKSIKFKLENIGKKYGLLVFILFGSRAKGTSNSKSDYDFAFFPSENFSTDDEINLFNDLMILFNDEKIDLINLKFSKKLYVINNIFQEGLLIYEKKKGIFKKMKYEAWFNYNDFKRYYDRQFQLTKENLEKLA